MNRALEAWARDILHAARALRRAPGFTVVTVTTLALAIGANTAIFSVVDAVLLDPLPFHQSDRLVSILGSSPGSDLPDEFGVPDELFVQYRDDVAALEDVAFYGVLQSTMRTDDWVERLFMSRVSPSFFSTLQVTPVLGRLPTTEDGEEVVVISHGLWTNRLGGDDAIIGRSYEMAGTLRTIIGVMEPGFQFPDRRVSLWISSPINDAEVTPGGFNFNVVGRLAPGASQLTLETEIEPLARRLPEQLGGPPQYATIMAQYRPIVRTLEEQVIGDIAGPLWMLLATVGIVLLIACANVANLFIARAESRRQDLAVRRAVGAGRAGLIRTQMSEALILAGLGGLFGAFLASAGVPALVQAAPEGIIGLDTVSLNLNALLFTAGVSILAAFAFGLLPAIRFSNPSLQGGLERGGRRGVGGRGHGGRNTLVVIQTASALVLLVGSGLLVQSFWRLNNVDAGYDTNDIFTFQVAPSGGNLTTPLAFALFHQDFMERLVALPGVESAGVVEMLPLDEGARQTRFATDLTEVTGEEGPMMHVTFTGGDYFETMGIELLSGRTFESIDQGTGVSNAIVSRSAAERLWPGENPLGRLVRPLAIPTEGWWTVVGVVEDIMLNDFRQAAPEPLVYLPLVGPSPDEPWPVIGSPAYVVRSARAELLAPEVRALAREVAPNAPVYRIFTMRELAGRSMAQLSFTMLTLSILSGLALILAAVGLYGVLSYVVSQRTREIAVRMALGARAAEVRRMIVVQGGRVTLVGVVLGLLAALGLTRVLGNLLYGVGALDAVTFVAIPAAMLAVAMLASYIPARRASSVDPMEALRGE